MTVMMSMPVMIISAMIFSTFPAQAAPANNAAPFNHTRTGFILKDVHTTLRCEQCHVDGVFKNTPRDCAGCHTIGSRVAAKPKPINHVQTTQKCDTCHTSATSFLVKNFNHSGISTGCASCHNGQSQGVVSKPLGHFPTLLPCESCHTNTNTFTSWKMDHMGITSGCQNCHGGQYPGIKAKSISHIATTAPCEICHSQSNTANFSTFFGAVYGHDPVTVKNNCISCHGGSIAGATTKPVNHIVTSGAQCDTCHTQANTANFSTFSGALFNHITANPPVAGVCSTCHNGSFPGVPGKPTNHLPTTDQCDTCHTQSNTSNYVNFLGAAYSHSASAAGSCSTCHNGTFTGVLGKPNNHVPTNLQCDTCHTKSNTSNYVSFLGAFYDHANASGNCSGCHSGTHPGVLGKSGNHLPTTAQCDTCHTKANTSNYVSFVGGFYNHNGSAGICSTCHNGSFPSALGKHAGHLITNAQCDTCHTQALTVNFTTFLGAIYDHTGVVPGTCNTCHNGTKAKGKTANHINTSVSCDQCHTKAISNNYTTFTGIVNPHTTTTITGACSSCHNGIQARGKQINHINTGSSDCDVCHTVANTANFTTFLGAKYDHVGVVPGSCANCHNGTGAIGKPASHLVTTAVCDTCHTQSNTANFTTFLGATYNHSGVVAGSCANCHNGTQAIGKPVTHIATTAACDTCHTQSNTLNFTSFLGAVFNHTGVAPGSCATCHDGIKAKGKPVTHIATTAACDTCHTQSNTLNFTTFLGATFNHTGVAPGSCASCHNGVKALGKPAGHSPTTAACDACHTQTNTNNFTTFLGASLAHDASMAGICQTCHNGAAARGKSVGHVPVNMSCDAGGCHAMFNGTSVTSFAGGTLNHSVVAATPCSTCHNGSYTTQGTFGAVAKVTRHIPTTITGSLDCNTCHKGTPPNGKPTAGAAAWSVGQRMNHNGAMGGGNPVFCVTCHLTGTTYQGRMEKKRHEGASVAKDCSRSGCHKPLGRTGATYIRWD